MLIGVCVLGVIASGAMLSASPLIVVAALLCLLAARTAWKARWKSHDVMALALYGFHSHLQQIPIFVGQMRYRSNDRQGRQAAIVEYK